MREVLEIAKALADETRLRVLVCLEGSTLCLCHLTEILGLSDSTVSKHLSVLTDSKLLVCRQKGRWHYYRWAGEEATPCVQAALTWVRQHALNHPVAQSDMAKRALVLLNSPVPCPPESLARVLFLCLENSCRSQMAEALLRAYAGDRFEVYSAGLEPKPIHEMTRTVMEEIGIAIRGQESKSVLPFLGRMHFGFLITVCADAEQRCPIFPGVAKRLHWPVEDPAAVTGSKAARLAAFRAVRDDLDRRIRAWLAEQGITPKRQK